MRSEMGTQARRKLSKKVLRQHTRNSNELLPQEGDSDSMNSQEFYKMLVELKVKEQVDPMTAQVHDL